MKTFEKKYLHKYRNISYGLMHVFESTYFYSIEFLRLASKIYQLLRDIFLIAETFK